MKSNAQGPKSEAPKEKEWMDDEDQYANPKSRIENPKSEERKRDPELLRPLGVTEEELEDPATALLSAGTQKMWAVIKAMKLPFMGEPDYGYRSEADPPSLKGVPAGERI